MRRFTRHRLAVISLVVIIIIFVLALLAPLIAPFPARSVDIAVTPRQVPPGITRQHRAVPHRGRGPSGP